VSNVMMMNDLLLSRNMLRPREDADDECGEVTSDLG
jgi:hypothetical protein